ncbi:hypothetical protein H4S06_001999 [Coemansia sp. BCRC 34490]|nr:hypothetical protein H4S06_001999 [Coemansia sp. BCRC 34490]
MESIFSLDFGNMPTCRATAAGSKKAPFTSPTETFKEMMLASVGFGMTKLGCVLRGRSTSLIIPLVRKQLAQSLSGATMGSLTIKENGLETVFGQPGNGGPHVHLTVLDEQFWVRLMLVQDLGFAEAYMAGEVAVSSLVDFVRFYIYNRAVLDGSFSSPLVSSLMYLTNTRFINSVLNAASNISAHYDLGNEIFEMFLDSTMTYSCAVWKEPSDTLEKAQLRKLDMLIDKAHVCKDDYILDLGCGWGSLAMRAVERTGCRVLGITLSIEQKEAAERRIAQAGMSGHIEIMLVDYRNLDPTEYCFDKIISLEMVEHVGHEYLDVYFGQCSKLLNEHHGIMVLQASTMNEERYEQYRHTVDFINKYIFPGGHCPSVSALVAAATRGSNGFLMLESAANFPDHYARTLRAWRDRFLHGHDRIKYTAETKYIQSVAIDSVYPYIFNAQPKTQIMCNPKQQSSASDYTANFPMAVAQPGETIYTAWEANGHLNNASPTKVQILYYADSSKQFADVSERTTAPVAASFNYATDQNCFVPSQPNTSCLGSWVVPKNLVPGKTYHFVWFWYYNGNPVGEWYSTCFDMQIKDSSHVVKTAAMADIMKLGDPPNTYSNGLDSKAKDLIAQVTTLPENKPTPTPAKTASATATAKANTPTPLPAVVKAAADKLKPVTTSAKKCRPKATS